MRAVKIEGNNDKRYLITRRNAIATVLGTVAWTTSPRSIAQTGGMLGLTVGGAPIVPFSNLIVAAGKGFFTDAGLSVQRKIILAPDIAQSALASGDIEIASMPIDVLARGHVAGFDWKILYPADLYDAKAPDAYVVVRSDLPFKGPRDLEGRTVAMVFGSIGEVGFKAWMKANGADPTKVNIVNMAYPQMVGALQAKTVDAAHMVLPGFMIATENGFGKIVGADLDAVGKRFMVSAHVARASWITENPEKAKRFVSALARATQYIIDDPQGALPIVAKETRLDEKLAAKFFPSLYGAATSVSPDEIQGAIDFFAREGFIARGFSYKDIVSDYAPVR